MCWDTGEMFNRNTGGVTDKAVVDAVMSGVSTRVSVFSPTDSLGGKWSYDWGWIDDSYFPWIYSYKNNNWFYLYSGLDSDMNNGYWTAFYTSDFSDYGWGYVYPSIGWWKLSSDMSSTWIHF
jgi:hypothetical protein